MEDRGSFGSPRGICGKTQSVKSWPSGGADATDCSVISRRVASLDTEGWQRAGSGGSQAMLSDLLIKEKLKLSLLFARVPE